MRVNNFTIAPFVDQKFMAKPDTIKTHSPWIIDIAELVPTTKEKYEYESFL